MTSTKASIHLVTETQRGFASKPEKKMRQSRPMPSATASTSRSISSCSRAYQSALEDRLEYELTFNDYSRAIRATGDADASYDIENSLEYEIVTQPELACMIANQYNGRLAILYDRILRHRKISRATPSGISTSTCPPEAWVLMLFEDVSAPFARNTESFCNPKITKVEVTIEGIPNQLLSGYACLSDVGRGEEVICSIARQETPPRGGRGGERPWSR